jgi:DNA-binding transcriptional MocR family regulator
VRNTLRLSFVTVPPDRIEVGVAALAGVLERALNDTSAIEGPP